MTMSYTAKLYVFALVTALVFILSFSFVTGQDNAQNKSLGLKFETKKKYQSYDRIRIPFGSSLQSLPKKVDLANQLPPAGQQGKQNSCVGWAIAYGLKSYQEKVEQKWPIKKSNKLDYYRVFSPAYIYNQINEGKDRGAYISKALDFLKNNGVVSWQEFPYNQTDYKKQPDRKLLGTAKRYRIGSWETLNPENLGEIKIHLADQKPVIIGAVVDEKMYKAEPRDKKGIYIWKKQDPKTIGGHAMLVVGYDDDMEAFKILNSWGNEWGNNGYLWLSYDLFSKVVLEAYVTTDIKNETEIKVKPKGDKILVLAGMKVRHGDIIDAVIPIYQEVDTSNMSVGRVFNGERIGGAGGGVTELRQKGYFISGLIAQRGYYFGRHEVVHIQVIWQKLTANGFTGEQIKSTMLGSGNYVKGQLEAETFTVRQGYYISDIRAFSSYHTSGETFLHKIAIVESQLIGE